MTCNLIKSKVMEQDDWIALHEPHGKFTTKKLERAPRGYPAHWLVCLCGAMILVPKKKKEQHA